MNGRMFLLMLAGALVMGEARAQTTTTTVPQDCAASSATELQAAAGADPDWQEVMKYAAFRRFDVTHITNVVKCTGGSGDAYLGSMPNLAPKKPGAFVSYEPHGPALQHTRLLYYRSASHRVLLDVKLAITTKSYFDSTGALRRWVTLDIHGHRLSQPQLATLARRRSL